MTIDYRTIREMTLIEVIKRYLVRVAIVAAILSTPLLLVFIEFNIYAIVAIIVIPTALVLIWKYSPSLVKKQSSEENTSPKEMQFSGSNVQSAGSYTEHEDSEGPEFHGKISDYQPEKIIAFDKNGKRIELNKLFETGSPVNIKMYDKSKPITFEMTTGDPSLEALDVLLGMIKGKYAESPEARQSIYMCYREMLADLVKDEVPKANDKFSVWKALQVQLQKDQDKDSEAGAGI